MRKCLCLCNWCSGWKILGFLQNVQFCNYFFGFNYFLGFFFKTSLLWNVDFLRLKGGMIRNTPKQNTVLCKTVFSVRMEVFRRWFQRPSVVDEDEEEEDWRSKLNFFLNIGQIVCFRGALPRIGLILRENDN